MDEEKKAAMIMRAEDRALDALIVIEAKDPAAAAQILDEHLGDGKIAGIVAVKKAAEAHPLFA